MTESVELPVIRRIICCFHNNTLGIVFLLPLLAGGDDMLNGHG